MRTIRRALRSLILTFLTAVLLIVTGERVPARAGGLSVTPSLGVENGGFVVGGNLRYFFVPNLAVELDGGYGSSVCANCSLSESTVTANLVYAIHPGDRFTLYLASGGGLALFDLSSPVASQAFLPVFDIGAGGTVRIGKNVGITLENRWFIPLSGGISQAGTGNLAADRWFAGLTTSF